MGYSLQAVILAAGKGERLRPLTDNKPKALLPLANRPLIDYLLEKLEKLKIDEIAVVVGYGEDKLSEHLKEKNVKIIKQKEQLGTAHVLYQAKNFVKDKFLAIYGDLFFEDDLKDFVELNKTTVGIVEVEDVSAFGKVEISNCRLVAIKEKSESGRGFVNSGIYLFYPDIFDAIEKTELSERGEYELTDSIMKLKDVEVKKLSGYWRDIGYPWDYLDINLYLLNKIGFSVGENTEMWNNATIRKPVIIGSNCTIKNCVLDNCIIGDNCVIGEFSVVKRSVVMRNTNVPHLNYVADSIIGENVNLGAGTKIANLKFNGTSVKVNIKDKRIDSRKMKFGAIIGDNVKTGINVSIYPGVKIGSNTWIDSEILVRKDISNNVYLKLKQNIEEEAKKLV
ncbi:MAG: sugar phosphate nucleotidyltransferase [Candidatus Aenigmarchaeota archaeon]|nr:sugar phosphate nucleotidyltransferase [Candidatus Aenigmarchaeota archaeon]MDW8149613.1 sugar phosphate nucleotidyltransferase [Candidatus Aenigmarchaeota archaeon]